MLWELPCTWWQQICHVRVTQEHYRHNAHHTTKTEKMRTHQTVPVGHLWQCKRATVMCTSRSGEIFTPMISTHSSSTKQLLYQFQSVHKSLMQSWSIDCILIPVAAASTVYIGVAAPCKSTKQESINWDPNNCLCWVYCYGIISSVPVQVTGNHCSKPCSGNCRVLDGNKYAKWG